MRRGRKAAGADVDYPNRSVTLIVGFDPGASASISAHIFADGVRKHLARPEPFIINHKPGASGLLDADFFMKQPADGYTLLWPVEGAVLSNTPGGILTTACAHMRISPGSGAPREYVLVIAGEHRRIMAGAGWSKDDIRRFCFNHTQTSAVELKRPHLLPEAVQPRDESGSQSVVPGPEDFLVVAARRAAGAFSCYIPAWSQKRSSQSVTKEIHWP